jgi:hypothetical protein
MSLLKERVSRVEVAAGDPLTSRLAKETSCEPIGSKPSFSSAEFQRLQPAKWRGTARIRAA